MKLVKEGLSIELTNEIQIQAYLNSGYIPMTEEPPKKKKKGAKGDGTA